MLDRKIIPILVVLALAQAACGLPLAVVSTPTPQPLAVISTTETVAPLPTDTSISVAANPSPTPVQTKPAVAAATAPAVAPATAPATAPAVAAGPVYTITQLAMSTPSQGWALTLDGKVLHTAQGPTAWQVVTPQGSGAGTGFLFSAAFPKDKPQSALLAAQPLDNSGAIQIFITTDSGLTWKKGQAIQLQTQGDTGLTQLFSRDGQHAWLLGQIHPGMMHVYTILYASQDGGQTWTLIQDPMNDPGGPSQVPGSYSDTFGDQLMDFPTPLVGFAGGVQGLFKTSDGGKTWGAVKLPKGPAYPAASKTPTDIAEPPHFTSAKDGAFLYRVHSFNDAPMPPGDMFQALPLAYYVYVTHDGGTTWTPYPAPAPLGTVTFLDGQTGWFLGGANLDPAQSAALYLTIDGGKTWKPVAGSHTPPIGAALQFVDAQHGFAYNLYSQFNNPDGAFGNLGLALSTRPYLFTTQDGGVTWTKVGK